MWQISQHDLRVRAFQHQVRPTYAIKKPTTYTICLQHDELIVIHEEVLRNRDIELLGNEVLTKGKLAVR